EPDPELAEAQVLEQLLAELLQLREPAAETALGDSAEEDLALLEDPLQPLRDDLQRALRELRRAAYDPLHDGGAALHRGLADLEGQVRDQLDRAGSERVRQRLAAAADVAVPRLLDVLAHVVEELQDGQADEQRPEHAHDRRDRRRDRPARDDVQRDETEDRGSRGEEDLAPVVAPPLRDPL